MDKRSALALSLILALIAQACAAQVIVELPAPAEPMSVPVGLPEGSVALPAAPEPSAGEPLAEDPSRKAEQPLSDLERATQSLGRDEKKGQDSTEKPAALDRLFGEGAAAPKLGIDVSAMDLSVRPQDDFFRHVNGTWLKSFTLPPDKTRYGVFDELREKSELALRSIIEDAAAKTSPSENEGKIADLYKSYMDEAGIEARGLRPLAAELAGIDRLRSVQQLPAMFARFGRAGFNAPIVLSVDQDAKNPAAYLASLNQGGLGLPDRDYYFNADERTRGIQHAYVDYLAKLFAMSGESNAVDKANAVYSLEKALAEKQWTKVDNRDPEKTYNKTATGELSKLGAFDFSAFLRSAHVPKTEQAVNVSQPSYLTGLAEVAARTPIETWKLYLKARALDASAGYLTAEFVKASFDYKGRALSGQLEMRPRWKRGVALVDGALGEVLGQEYVKRHFPESSKKIMAQMVENLRAAYAERIKSRPWMSEETKAKALEKLEKFTTKIGYPDKWRDDSKLHFRADDLVGNVRRSNRFDYDEMLGKLGKPVDRGEWHMTPQTVNAYYDPVMNEIVFPAAILQGAFFDPEADDAVNYGAIGAVIGHEMSHGFDDEGSKFDATGQLTDWWTPADRAEFDARARRLAEQFDRFEPLPGRHINGALTLGENIGDLGGITVAYEAYLRSLGGKPAPVIEGFTGAQRFFMGWAQVWRLAIREEALALQLATDPHSPAEYRVNGTMPNHPGFYDAYGVKEGDRHFLPDSERVKIW